MRLRAWIVILGVLACCGARALAWNSTAHMVVARIAWQQMTPEQRARATEILKGHPKYARDLEAPVPPGATAAEHDEIVFMVAATWPDMIKGTARRDEAKDNHRHWHYIDHPVDVASTLTAWPLALDMNWNAVRDRDRDPANAVQALAKNYDDLKNADAETKAKALCWILHLTGDIHQPLHCASLYNAKFPTGDKGGNSIRVHGAPDARELHGLWDGLLGRKEGFKIIRALADELTAQEKPTAAERAETRPSAWSAEGYEIAVAVVYDGGKLQERAVDGVVEIDKEYLDRATAVARQRIAVGGARLGKTLAELLR